VQQIENDLSRLCRIGSPVDDASRGGAACLELFEISRHIFECMIADSRRCIAQLQPIRLLRYPLGTIGLNDIGGVGDIPAQLGVLENGQRGLRKWRRCRGIEVGVGRSGTRLSGETHRTVSMGEDSVLARISAR
jgi:hypothetical protein